MTVNKVTLSFLLEDLKFHVGESILSLTRHFLLASSTSDLIIYKQEAIALDLSQTGTVNPNQQCDVSLCEIPVLPIVFDQDYMGLDSCDSPS